jgi:aspartyl-tRNA(Asn)/glutamyl-tRNA(Gln) amidotransferase subunit A
VPVNIAGLPAISLPCGKDKDGLPIGLQIIGKKFDDAKVLDVAYFAEVTHLCDLDDVKIEKGEKA